MPSKENPHSLLGHGKPGLSLFAWLNILLCVFQILSYLTLNSPIAAVSQQAEAWNSQATALSITPTWSKPQHTLHLFQHQCMQVQP